MHSNDVKPSHVALADQVAASQLNMLIASQASITNQMTILEMLERLHHGFMTKQGYSIDIHSLSKCKIVYRAGVLRIALQLIKQAHCYNQISINSIFRNSPNVKFKVYTS